MDDIKLGLKENWKQFTLLVIVNAFVGGMVGLERSILPEIAEKEFGLVVKTAILSFIIVFGVTKALANYFAGALANKYGRKKLLILGWLIGTPIPFILMFAPNWNWIIIANILLGINQGLAWSSTVVMKIDLVGDKQRGFAMGLNEFAGYLSVAIVAFLTGWIASVYGLRPYPFYIGIILVILGLIFSIFFIKDTKHHVAKESKSSTVPLLNNIFLDTTWKNKNLGSVSQAGLINNLNDGMVWGIFPLLLASKNFTIEQIGIITAIYPAVWGIGQLFTGKMADKHPKKEMLFWGMLLQAITLLLFVFANNMYQYIILSSILGWGTAMVYPTFLASIAENTNPIDRAKSIGIFRLWRDLGYAIGAILTGLIADAYNINSSIVFIGVLTLISAIIIKARMKTNTSCISKEDIQKKKNYTIIDVRTKEERETGYIVNSIHIPLNELERRIKELPTDKLYVTACGKGGGRSIKASEILQLNKYSAFWLCGGTLGWTEEKAGNNV
ncbi:MAG: MFS transporter [Bacteroidetes bacterium]|nr:MFS transporter [Bacteroidota bacterium]MBU1373270.1 MFS transporter [Bacteroidota bacterium]MBU1484356.1 MFS transporter [Bacteroidota bacterium]MBU1762141.1 MFS transporter [Bacteroidota bacterium]MBU2269480.1 MFS transporter [Bacteroidota bacterium]